MNKKETPGSRQKRFKAMTSSERKDLIRKKMKKEGLEEGSGVAGEALSSSNQQEVWDLILITSCFP